MAEVAEPTTTAETNFRQASMSKWMTGLKDALPDPTLGAGASEEAETPVEGSPAAAPVSAAPASEPKPAATPTPAPAPAEPTDESRWPRSAKEWKNFTEKRKAKETEYEKQLQERDAKIKDLEGKTSSLSPEIQKEIDDLKKSNGDLSNQLRILEVTKHPQFIQYFKGKTNAALNQLKGCVTPDKLDSVTKLVQAQDSESRTKEIESLLEEMTPLQQGRFINVINQLGSIEAERESEVARAQQDYEQMIGQAKAQKQQQQASFSRMLDSTVKTMQDSKNGRPEYQLRDGETEWNAAVQKRIDSGRRLITGNLAPEIMFKAAFDAAAYPDVLAGYKGALVEIDKLKGQIAAMTASNPKVKSEPKVNGTEQTSMPKDARPMDYTKKWVQSFGAAMRGEQ